MPTVRSSPRLVRSPDGTAIATHTLGRGPALVVLHGALTTGAQWRDVGSALAEEFQVVLVDRRGHGASGWTDDAQPLEREVEDTLAVVAELGGVAGLLGHSSGAIVALEAALAARSSLVKTLLLYEPPLAVAGPVGGAALPGYRAALERGQPDAALAIGLTRFAGASEAAVAERRRSAQWPEMVALAHTWPAQIEWIDALRGDVERYRSLRVPTGLLIGSLSPERPLQQATRALAAVLPDAEVLPLEGQGHTAQLAAPGALAATIGSFLRRSR